MNLEPMNPEPMNEDRARPPSRMRERAAARWRSGSGFGRTPQSVGRNADRGRRHHVAIGEAAGGRPGGVGIRRDERRAGHAMAGEAASALVAGRHGRRIARGLDAGVDIPAGLLDERFAGRRPVLASGVGRCGLRMRLMRVAGCVISRRVMAVAGMRARNGRRARGENSRKADQPENCSHAVHRSPLPGLSAQSSRRSRSICGARQYPGRS